ncbi:MAG: NAD(+)/NADH kinase, partial [Clostridia bacterium]|nr:NAD(+)/NADH kinase [Clostridia bacterium]
LHDVPLLGVNLGKVGYLTEVDPDNLEMLSRLKTGEYKIEEKMLLQTTLDCGNGAAVADRLAVNDVVISHNVFLGISDFDVENEDGDSIKYRADGIIASTPVGSTAYSLSAGGPIVSHNVDTILLTPVSPHSFFNRSILFNAHQALKIKNVTDGELSISIDGRFYKSLSSGGICKIKRAEKSLKTVHFASGDMFSTLFKKMRLLEDIK